MLKDITKSKEAISIKNSGIKRTFESVLNDIPAFNRSVNEQIRWYDEAQIKSIQKAEEIRCMGMPKVYKKTLNKKSNN